MSYHYSDPERENNPTALPDIEVFYDRGFHPLNGAGYYWQYGSPGCIPTSFPLGPFSTENAAIEAAREDV